MRIAARLAVLIGCILSAQILCPSPGSAGTIWISQPISGSDTVCTFRPANVFEFSVYADSLDSGIRAYEFGLETPPELTIVSASIPSPCDVCSTTGLNFIVGLSSCSQGAGPFTLLHASATYVTAIGESEQICIRASVPSSLDPASPGYVDCADDLQPFSVPQRCIVAACGLPVDRSTFGMVKAQY